VLNKVHDAAEEQQLRAHLPDLPVIGMVRERESIRKADLDGRSPFDVDAAFVEEIAAIKGRLQQEIGASADAATT
jgi:CO dehydrogenase maturation factor